MRPVRLRSAWRFWPKGHLFLEMSAAQAELMVRAGQAEYADTPKDKGEAPGKAPAPRTAKRPVLPGILAPIGRAKGGVK